MPHTRLNDVPARLVADGRRYDARFSEVEAAPMPTLEPNSFIVVTSRPSPLNQANLFNCTVNAEQPVPAAGGGD
jgi:hypothetical protein